MMTGNEIRRSFCDWFGRRKHEVIASASLVPEHDPTLLFTNAGMVQFKDVFLGLSRSPYPRAVTAQKCVRAGGKHNDLDSVGRTARHHTMFEMLGNFSFGDYFKAEAIGYAWEFLTGELGVSAERLWATVHRDDDEAAEMWPRLTGVSRERVVRLGDRDNFWAMGDTGPCGPCSELIFDRGSQHDCGPDCAIGGCDCDRWLELWNLVFMQYERDGSGRMTSLPRPSIDTGMGLERITSVLQNVDSNFETDLFAGLIHRLEDTSGRAYDPGPSGMAFRVIADHVRCGCFLIGDGVVPGNDGRGYVLRRILRRAVRFGRSLGLTRPHLTDLVPLVTSLMGAAYPDLVAHERRITDLIRVEEERFGETLTEGMKRAEELLAEAVAAGESSLSGRAAFLLYDTYGFPLDLARDMAEERRLTVDEQGFLGAMAEQRERARQASLGAGDARSELVAGLGIVAGEFVGGAPDSQLAVKSLITAVTSADDGKAAVVLDRTPFYPEGGGQVGDVGFIRGQDFEAEVTDTVRGQQGTIVHLVSVCTGSPQPGLEVTAEVDCLWRRNVARHHTATHLLHRALRQVLGEHAAQSGSLVSPDRLRFDYSHYEAVGRDALDRIEDLVNEWIMADLEVSNEEMTRSAAERAGAVALFGEKYGEVVRVVSAGEVSRELCGGTHVARTGMIGSFAITSEQSVGSGLRRIEAVAGTAVHQLARRRRDILARAAELARCAEDELPDRVSELQVALRQAEREREEQAACDARTAVDQLLTRAVDVEGISVAAGVLAVDDLTILRSLIDSARDRLDCGVVVLGARADDKAVIIAGATRSAVERGVHCGRLVSEVARIVDGKGGGKPDMAQGGGRAPERLTEALAGVADAVRASLAG